MNIEDATTQDLMEALAKRSTALVIIGCEVSPIDPTQMGTFTNVKGFPLTALGMIDIMREYVLSMSRKTFHQLF